MERNVSGLVGFGDAVPFPLAWGEVIPLHFLVGGAKVVVVSQPNRRYTDSVEMIPELLELGIYIMHYTIIIVILMNFNPTWFY